jgi:hypothetical protein
MKIAFKLFVAMLCTFILPLMLLPEKYSKSATPQ